jgi:hypothetical protein
MKMASGLSIRYVMLLLSHKNKIQEGSVVTGLGQSHAITGIVLSSVRID